MNQFSPACLVVVLLVASEVTSFSTRRGLSPVVVPRQLAPCSLVTAESRTSRQWLLLALLSSKSDGDDDWYSDYNPQAYQYKERDSDSNNEGYSGGGGEQRYGQDRYGGGRSSGRSSSSSGGGRGGSGRFGAQRGSGGYERDASADDSSVDVGAVERLIGERTAARKGGDFDAADQIRDQLLNNYGVQVWDKERIWRTGCSASGSGARRPGLGGGGGGGRFGGDRSGGRGREGGVRQQRPPKDFGPKGHDYERSPDAGPITASITEAEINELIAARLQCKMSRRFDEADRIQVELTSNGVYIHDARKEWRADGVMFGDYANGDRPGKERGSRSSDRNKPFDQSPYSMGIDILTDDQVAAIDALVSRRAGAKLSRNYKTADNIRDELKDNYNVFIDDRLRQWSVGGDFGPEAPGNHDRPWVMSLHSSPVADEEQEATIMSELEKRSKAKAARDFDTADSIRESLSTNFNVAIDDRLRQWSVGGDFGLPTKNKKDGQFVRRGGGDLSEEEVAEISDLVEERARAKKNRDFETADELRDTLEARFFVKVDDKSELFGCRMHCVDVMKMN